MKRTIILTMFLLFTSQIGGFAATSDDVLSKYGVKVNTVDIEGLKSKLTAGFESYNELANDYYESAYLKNAEKLIVVHKRKSAAQSSANAEACGVALKRLSDCLTAMVNADAGYEEIADVEEQYRQKAAELNELMLIQAVSLSDTVSYSSNTREVSSDEVKSAFQEFETIKSRLRNAVIKDDIGELNSLRSPTDGVFNKSSGFGNRINPITGTGIENHSGLDLAAPKDTPVLALFNGTVITAAYNDSLGNYAVISHSKELQTLYAHMNSLCCKKGDTVKQYQTIGFVGTTGSSTGNHLHLAVYINGVKMDPEILFHSASSES